MRIAQAMLFTAPAFLFVFLPLSVVGFFACAAVSRATAIRFLALASIVFYAWWDARWLLVLLPSIALNFLIGRRILAAGARSLAARRWLVLGLTLDLGALVGFKYTGFLVASALAAVGRPSIALHPPLPLGISFFTFTQIAYLVDAFRGHATSGGLARYALFVTYFPHLIAGPIIHHADMMPQFDDERRSRLRLRRVASGLGLLAIGLFKKVVVADGVAPVTALAFAPHAGPMTAADAWVGALAYTSQLYFDFSGYSDMAVGLSRMLDLELPFNFDSPYQATSIIDFWRRWHMTLSRFLRDYLYIPLGGNRRGPVRRYLNLSLTMVLGGCWHGAGWTFVAWGGLHGLYLMVAHGWRALGVAPRSRAVRGVGAVAGWGLTFVAVVVAWVFFRADSLATAGAVLAAMGGAAAGGVGAVQTGDVLWVATSLSIAFVAPNSQRIVDAGWWSALRVPEDGAIADAIRCASIGFCAMGCFLLTLITIAKIGTSEFLYFNF